jgi:glycolate oxidase FAD binding subunit
MRDYVIGLRAVDGCGTPFSGGGQVVKNAAGYDLCKLLTGSLGTLGVITQVTLMVKPMPEATAFAATSLDDPEKTEALLGNLVQTRTLPSAIEVITGPWWDDAAELADLPAGARGRLLIGLEGTVEEVDWMLDQLRREWTSLSVSGPLTVRGDAAHRLWDRLTEFPASRDSESPTPVTIEMRVMPSAVAGTIGLLSDSDSDCSIQAHAGDGVIRAGLTLEPIEACRLLTGKLRPAVASGSGSAIVLSCPEGVEWDRETVWGPPDDGSRVMMALKKRFDPQGILNPGRFVFDDVSTRSEVTT